MDNKLLTKSKVINENSDLESREQFYQDYCFDTFIAEQQAEIDEALLWGI